MIRRPSLPREEAEKGRERDVRPPSSSVAESRPTSDGVKEGRKREGVKEEGILLRKRRRRKGRETGRGRSGVSLNVPQRGCSFRSLHPSIHPVVSTIIQDGTHHPRRPLNYVAVNDDGGGATARAPKDKPPTHPGYIPERGKHFSLPYELWTLHLKLDYTQWEESCLKELLQQLYLHLLNSLLSYGQFALFQLLPFICFPLAALFLPSLLREPAAVNYLALFLTRCAVLSRHRSRPQNNSREGYWRGNDSEKNCTAPRNAE